MRFPLGTTPCLLVVVDWTCRNEILVIVEIVRAAGVVLEWRAYRLRTSRIARCLRFESESRWNRHAIVVEHRAGVIGSGVALAERSEAPVLFDEMNDRAVVVLRVIDEGPRRARCFGIRREGEERNAKAKG